jgi:hypothetical protein
VLAGALAMASACSDSSGGGGGGGGGSTSQFLGIMSTDDGLQSGEISITLQTGSPDVEAPTAVKAFASVSASGTHKLGGTAVNMTGTYDDQTKGLTLTGGGYTVAGFFDGVDRLTGGFSGPGNSGIFVTTEKGNATVAYCGTFTGGDDGTFSFVVNNQNKVVGTAYTTSGSAPIPLDGTKSGSSITIYAPGSTTVVLASGTISGNSASGTWDDHQGNTGTWTGSVCQ